MPSTTVENFKICWKDNVDDEEKRVFCDGRLFVIVCEISCIDLANLFGYAAEIFYEVNSEVFLTCIASCLSLRFGRQ